MRADKRPGTFSANGSADVPSSTANAEQLKWPCFVKSRLFYVLVAFNSSLQYCQWIHFKV